MKDIAAIIKKYDSELEYLSGYENCNSIVKCKCNRCGNIIERRWKNLTRYNTECRCLICQDKIAHYKSKTNHAHKAHVKPVKEREEEFIKTLAITKPTYTYISGYTNAKSNVLVKCNDCGYEMQYSVDRLTRKNKNIVCKNCLSIELKKQKEQKAKVNNMIKQQAKYINEIKANKRKEIKRIYKELIRNTLYIQTCKQCQNEFIEHSNSAYCTLCRKKINHHHSYKSLKKLYKRDKGMCHICNGTCNWNDKRIDKGTIIVGNTYPSIDHIIPLAKGGTDEWNNLGLAHVRCNTIKGINRGVVA